MKTEKVMKSHSYKRNHKTGGEKREYDDPGIIEFSKPVNGHVRDGRTDTGDQSGEMIISGQVHHRFIDQQHARKAKNNREGHTFSMVFTKNYPGENSNE